MELFKSTKISYCASLMFIAATSTLAVAEDLKVIGKVGDAPSTVYGGLDKDVMLICDIGKVGHDFGENNGTSSKPYWSFRNPAGSTRNFSTHPCVERKEEDDDKKGSKQKSDRESRKRTEPFSDCEIKFENDNSHFVLKIEDVIEEEYGDYVCHSGDVQNRSKTFHVQEIVTLSRLPVKGKPKAADLTFVEGELMDLYCNATGLRDSHFISWWKDGKDITKELKSFSGLFENFNGTDELNYEGTAKLEHRGIYTCRVDLRNDTDNQLGKSINRNSHQSPYPVQFEALYRVKEADSWKLPMYILLGEVVLIGLFTVIINIKEKRSSEDEADGQYEDSDDEDELPSRQNGNGVPSSKRNSSSSSSGK